jgi:hypothetical protein
MFVRDRHTCRRITLPKSLGRSGARASVGLTVTAVEVHTLISIEEGICWVVLQTMFLVVVFVAVLVLGIVIVLFVV